MWERLFARGQDAPACLVVSHRRSALQQADKILLLKDGRLHDQGRLEELLARSDKMQQLWKSKMAA